MRAATGGAGIGGAGAATIARGGALAFRTFFVGALTTALTGGGFGTAAGLGGGIRRTVTPAGLRRGFAAAFRAALATASGFLMMGACAAARRRCFDGGTSAGVLRFDGGTSAGVLRFDGGLSTMRLIGRPGFMRRISGKRSAGRGGRGAGRALRTSRTLPRSTSGTERGGPSASITLKSTDTSGRPEPTDVNWASAW